MASGKRLNQFYDTGGSGAIPTSRGEAYKWWVPFEFTSLQRLLMGTRLAQGPATLKELEAVTGGYQSVVWHIVRAWVRNRFATWNIQRGGGRRGRHSWREVCLTDDARRDLWRYGWVTRRVRLGDTSDPPLRDDMPEDPLEALRLHARKEFLRPGALMVLDQLLGWPKQNVRGMAAFTDNLAATRRYMDKFRAAGFVEDVDRDALPGRWRFTSPKWVLSAKGMDALDRHVDAMRRVCVASGYVPTRECEFYYPLQHASPCTGSMSADREPPCGNDCPLWEQVIWEREFRTARTQDSGFSIRHPASGSRDSVAEASP